MSTELRRIEQVLEIVQELSQSAPEGFRPGDVAQVLRERNNPIGLWQLRADFNQLRDQGFIACDEATADWFMVNDVAKQNAG